MTLIAFVDTETTGLDPDLHEIWEVGVVIYETDTREVLTSKLWQLPVDLSKADVMALNIGKFHDRRWKATRPAFGMAPESVPGYVIPKDEMPAWASEFALLTWGTHLAGAVVSFDEERLRKLLRKHGACPGWHYHLIDVEALACGALRQAPPWKSDDVAGELGVTLDEAERHTALGDAKWALRLYEAVMISEMAELNVIQ